MNLGAVLYLKYKTLWGITVIIVIIAAVSVLTVKPSAQTGADDAVPPVLVIDAGHGGADGGAVAPDGTRESDLNLDIALRLQALAALWGVDTVMTRDSDDIDYPPAAKTLSEMKKADQNARIGLINSVEGALLLSIHQNTFPAASPWGIQVFYGAITGGEELAAIIQDNMTRWLCPDNRRVAEPIDENIYLMRKAACPAVLVECGFLSNPGDLEKLNNEDYRMELAVVMLASCLTYIRGMSI